VVLSVRVSSVFYRLWSWYTSLGSQGRVSFNLSIMETQARLFDHLLVRSFQSFSFPCILSGIVLAFPIRSPESVSRRFTTSHCNRPVDHIKLASWQDNELLLNPQSAPRRQCSLQPPKVASVNDLATFLLNHRFFYANNRREFCITKHGT
jgi:hypothetical protein